MNYKPGMLNYYLNSPLSLLSVTIYALNHNEDIRATTADHISLINLFNSSNIDREKV